MGLRYGARRAQPPQPPPPLVWSCMGYALVWFTDKRASSAKQNPHHWYQRRLSVEKKNRHSPPPQRDCHAEHHTCRASGTARVRETNGQAGPCAEASRDFTCTSTRDSGGGGDGDGKDVAPLPPTLAHFLPGLASWRPVHARGRDWREGGRALV